MSFTLSNGNKDFQKDISERCWYLSAIFLHLCDLSISKGFEFQSSLNLLDMQGAQILMLHTLKFLKKLNVFVHSKAVNYTVEADTGRKRSPRVRFQDNLDSTFTGFLSLPSSSSNCQTLKLNVLVWFQLFWRSHVPQDLCVTNKVNLSMLNHFAVSSDGQVEIRGL